MQPKTPKVTSGDALAAARQRRRTGQSVGRSRPASAGPWPAGWPRRPGLRTTAVPLYLVLDPDGSLDAAGAFGLYVLIPAPTRVTTPTSAPPAGNVVRKAEGFLVPVGGLGAADEFVGAEPARWPSSRAPSTGTRPTRVCWDGTWTAAQLGEAHRARRGDPVLADPARPRGHPALLPRTGLRPGRS